MHAGTPFAQKGGGELALPKMDVPVGLVEWEVFLPERYRVKDFGGDAVPAALLPRAGEFNRLQEFAHLEPSVPVDRPISLQPGMIGGYIVDPSGGMVSRAQVTVTNEATGATARARTDATGRWVVVGIPPGRLRIEAESPGFKKFVQVVEHRPGDATNVKIDLQVAASTMTVEVAAADSSMQNESRQIEKQIAQQQTRPSANVANLQKRVAGVLPIPIDVPKAGNSYRFVRPLVVDEETKVTFTYRAGR